MSQWREVLEIKHKIYILPFRFYASDGYAFMAYAKYLAIPNNAKQRSLYSRCQGTNVVAVPPLIGTPYLCASDAHITLNFITGLVCHTQLIQHNALSTILYNIQLQSSCLDFCPSCNRCMNTKKHYVSEVCSASILRQEAPKLVDPLNQAIIIQFVFWCLYICYTMDNVQEKNILSVCSHI